MQTFLPYADYAETAKILDYRRLGKQRVECFQILKAIYDPAYGWNNHPAVKMWRNSEHELFKYAIAICDDWISRGFKDTMREKIQLEFGSKTKANLKIPDWLGNEDFHKSHKSNLIRKKPEHYGKLWPNIPNDLPYIWPTN